MEAYSNLKNNFSQINGAIAGNCASNTFFIFIFRQNKAICTSEMISHENKLNNTILAFPY